MKEDGTTICACCVSCDGKPHRGHEYFFEEVSKYGGEIVIFVVDDAVIMNNKNRTPIHTQAERMENIRDVVKKLGINAQVVPLESDLSNALVQVNSFKPDVYCKGSDQNTIFEASLCQLYPYMEISTIDRRPEISQSTTQLYFS